MKRGYKIFGITIIVVGILLFAFNLIFGSVLRWQLDNFSNGKIQLRSEKSSANIFSGTILFSDVLVEFDSVSVDEASKIYLRNLKFSSLQISHISIYQLLFKRNFSVGKIEFTNPELNFLRDTVISNQDLFTKIITPEVVKSKSQEAMFSFEIGEIAINQGAMHFRGRQGEEVDLKKINISIRDVYLSDLRQMEITKKDLSAHFKLNVNLYDVRKRFKDEYTFSIDSFSYYSDIKHLLVSGISLIPDSLDNFDDKPEIKFKTDYLKITGFELNEFILGKNLQFEKIQIANGYFWESKNYYFLNNEDEPDTTKKKSPIGVDFVNTFQADTFQLQNIDLLSLTKRLDTVYEVKRANIKILNIHVDSGFIAEYKYLSLAENTYLNSGSLRIHWIKPVYDFRCDTFSFDGNSEREFMKNIRFSHHSFSKEKNKQKLLIDARIDSLALKGLNIRKILKYESFHLSMFLQNPDVKVFEWDSLPAKNKKGKKGKFPSTVFLDDFRIQNGSFSFVSEISTIEAKVDQLNLLFDTLKISMNTNEKFDHIDFDAFELECEGLMYQNSTNPAFADIDRLFINERDVKLSGLQFSDGDGLLAETSGSNLFKSDGFSISDFSIKNLINNKEFICGVILFQKPEYYGKSIGNINPKKEKLVLSREIVSEKIAAALRGKINILEIDNVLINDGFIDFQNTADTLHLQSFVEFEMENIHYHPTNLSGDTLFYLPDYFQFSLNETSVTSSNLAFEFDDITYDNLNEELLIVNLSGETADGSSANSKFRIDIPEVNLKAPYWNPGNERAFSFTSIGVNSPKLFLEINQKDKRTSKKPKKKLHLPFLVSDSLIISDATFTIRINKQDDILEFYAADFNLGWKNELKESSKEEFKNDLLAGISFDIKDFTLNSEKSNVSLDNIYFNKQKNIIELEGLKQLAWKPVTDEEDKKLKNRISIPKLYIEYPHLYGKFGDPLGLWVKNITGNETNVEFYPTGGEDKKAPHLKISDSSAVKFLELFKYVQIDSTYFPNIHIRVHTDSTNRKPIDFKRISFHANGLLLDSTLLNPEKKSYTDDIFIHLHDREIYSADSMYKFRTSYLTYYYSKDQIVFDSLEVIPQFEKDEFFERAFYQTDRMQISTKNVVVDGIDLESLIKDGEYHFDKISINELRLLDHRDKHYPNMEGMYKPLPKEMLANIPAIFHIDTLLVNDSYVLYGEYVDKSNLPGEVFFEDFNATIYNVTNEFKKFDTSFMMTANIQSKLMGSADLDLLINVPLMERADYFWFSGGLNNIHLPEFNSMTQNLFGITIRKGRGNVEIPLITATNSHSVGEMTFLYKQFKLAVYNRKKAKLHRGIASPLIDFMMNNLLIKSNNPRFLRKEKVGEVYFVRDQEKSVFNYIWKSTMSGALSTMGFNKKEQRQAAKEKRRK